MGGDGIPLGEVGVADGVKIEEEEWI